jgi:glutathione S-transferase
MQAYTLIIGNKAYSSWSLRPWLLMKHAGIGFEENRISLYEHDSKQTLLRHSGAGKVPVLRHGELIIWDSLAICEYLAEKHPEKRLWPADAAVRAHARSTSAEMHSGFGNLRSQMPMNVRRKIPNRATTREASADIARIQEIWEECRSRFGGTGPFLYGEFSIADAMFAPVVSRFHTYGVALSDTGADYSRHILALPAFLEWVAAANAETEVNPSYEP